MKNHQKIYFQIKVFLFLLVRSAFSQNQKLKFDSISLEQDLSQNTIGYILQDHKGFIWIGTEGGGLNRFNQETETFTHSVLIKQGLIDKKYFQHMKDLHVLKCKIC